MNFSIEQLQAFVTVYELRSLSKAGIKLNRHRTTVGQVISNLEDMVAVQLFERTSRSIEPTEEAHVLYYYAKQSVEQTRVFDKVAMSLAYGGLEEVTIAYPSFIPHNLLFFIRAQLGKDFPMLRANFVVRSNKAAEEGMHEGDIHFSLMLGHSRSGIQGFDSVFIGHMEFLPFVRKGSPMSQVPPNEVFGELKTNRQLLLRSLVEEGFKDKVVYSADVEEYDQLALVIKMVKEGIGWAWLPKVLNESEFVTDSLEPLIFDELKSGMKCSISLVSLPSKQVLDVKKSIVVAIDEYVARYRRLQDTSNQL
ncbi:LysR family transcriptional regulator [Vibrio fortis]|uniref:LysR family transcriptional regulator n=1 Tax=Vibrio fortis TaxID=212667 RepID=A0A066UTD8_9VIBR|nr:LysR family transcriptional regulator [Vibrio fortis]KDN27463.1 LysR family transcriptional regulator [Vibrio fortis]